jgi:spore maturation protein CgeB
MIKLVVGNLNPGSTDLYRLIDDTYIGYNYCKQSKPALFYILRSIIYRITNHYIDIFSMHKGIDNYIKFYHPKMIIFHKILSLSPKEIKKIKKSNIKIVFFIHDHILNPVNQSSNFIRCLKYADLILTTKSYDVDVLKKMSRQENVKFINNFICSSKINKLIKKYNQVNNKIIVVSGFEINRFNYIKYLCDNGIKIIVYCGNEFKYWKPYINKIQNNCIFINKYLVGIEYEEAIKNCFLIISFLRKANLDMQTSRSIEIPAYGGLLLTEDTIEHRSMFLSDIEAVFFKNPEELIYKIHDLKSNAEKYNSIKFLGNKKVMNFNELEFRNEISKFYI